MHNINENDLPLGESLHEAMFRVRMTLLSLLLF